MEKIDISTYLVTDDFFGAPYIDIDEERTDPLPHRYVHGGFDETSTRFAFWFPPAAEWEGRMYQPLEGANAGHEDERERGPLEAEQHFCLRWAENAEHVPVQMVAPAPGRAARTWLIDYQPHLEQCLVDLATWVEDGVRPSETHFEFSDGKVTLPGSASERGGIQPVVKVAANGSDLAEVRPGEEVTLTVQAEVPPGAGTVVGVRWDFDGSGAFPTASTSTELCHR